ncbi:MAG: ATP synthase F0 subunit B [Deltaproteobacteria bacterium]|nr:ATP synthase F0 subunit B [Deltaproteobacteria bacterium]
MMGRRYLILAFVTAVVLILLTSPAWASEGSSFSYWWKFIWRILNFLILAAVIFKVARKPLKSFLAGKKGEAQETLEQLEEAKTKAEAELAEIKTKLAEADQEIERLLAHLSGMAVKHQRQILDDAQARAESITTGARAAAEGELKRARESLTLEVGGDIIALASQKLRQRLTPEDHQRILSEVVARMEASPG